MHPFIHQIRKIATMKNCDDRIFSHDVTNDRANWFCSSEQFSDVAAYVLDQAEKGWSRS